MLNKIIALAVVVVMSHTATTTFGQASRSPFTSQGIGDIYDMGLAHNKGMGGLGISNASYWHLNNINPALLPYNSLTVFSAAIIAENRSIENSTGSETNGSGNLAYLATAFPVKPGKWTTSVGLMPYSNVDYQSQDTVGITGAINGERALKISAGTGGFNQFYWSNGYAINKNIFVGLKAAYIFSNIESDVAFDLVDQSGTFRRGQNERVSVSDFQFSGGLAFKKDSIFNNKIQLKLGLTYDFGANLNAEKFTSTELRTLDIPIVRDSLEDVRGEIEIPKALGFGISFNNGARWMVGLDAKFQTWPNFRDFDGSNENLEDQVKVILGGELTPDPTSVTSYFKRVTYRFGLSYENTPYQVANLEGNFNQVNEFGINLGWSMPVSRISNLDFAITYGVRGNVEDTIIQEEYFRFHLGVTFNDQWFIKRKYN
ncbi:MAG: hypothetical protein AAGA64_05780 [Bacteroidota bacterium]